MNERITENIVREHFKNDPLFQKDDVFLEEQKSKIDHIQNLFKKASKNEKQNRGMPEFIISFKSYPDLLIVIECKSETSRHESKDKLDIKNYSVDGVLHYMNCAVEVNKKLNIIGIAVSGQHKDELKVSNFYYDVSKNNITKLSNKELLSLYSYIKYYENLPLIEKLSKIQITSKAIEYNEILNEHSIPETERCTFISAILLGIQHIPFRKSYFNYGDTKQLVVQLLVSCNNVLIQNNLDGERIKQILSQYGTINNHKIIQIKNITDKKTKKNLPNFILRDFITGIIKDIYPLLMQGQEGYDVLGKFYTEFIRYAGSDKKTGLVLTPSHVTELFCDLVNLTENDVVYDPCCGTGSFLISSMKRMLEIASNNKEKQKAIKNNQLIGTEVRSDMFVYACSNMMMRGDGKSNIYNKDCFNPNHKKIIKVKEPTVVMLNPPYDGGTSDQIRFINNAMEVLSLGGKCCAIVQMSCVLAGSGELLREKEKLLSKHTLVSVISMPNDLFYPVGVVTCVMVLEACKPHPVDYPVWFGYFKDDGHEKRKHKGRIDLGTFESKKTDLLKNYRYYDKKGMGLRKVVKYSDEWCAEAYMETDYSKITEEDFVKTIKDHVAFQFLNES